MNNTRIEYNKVNIKVRRIHFTILTFSCFFSAFDQNKVFVKSIDFNLHANIHNNNILRIFYQFCSDKKLISISLNSLGFSMATACLASLITTNLALGINAVNSSLTEIGV